jgi:hypothetical protein
MTSFSTKTSISRSGNVTKKGVSIDLDYAFFNVDIYAPDRLTTPITD